MKNRFLPVRGLAALVMCFSVQAAHSTTLYWDLNGATANTAVAVTGAWNGTNTFWNTASSGTGGAGQAGTTAADDLIFSSGTGYTTGTVTASGTRLARSITFEDNIVITLAGPVTVGGSGGSPGIFVNTGKATASTVSGLITLASAATVQSSGNTAGTLTFSGGFNLGANTLTISPSAARISITAPITGTGAVVVSGANTGDWDAATAGVHTYSGGTTLNPGAVVAVGSSSAGPAGSPTSGSFGTGTLNLAGGRLRSGIGAATTIGNPVNLTADSAFYANASEKNLVFSGPLTLSGGSHTLNSTVGNTVAGTTVIFDGNIGDGGNNLGFTKTGTGNLAINGTNTYGGITNISEGVLAIGSAASLPGFNIPGRFTVATGATLRVANAVTETEVDAMLDSNNFGAGSILGLDTSAGDRIYSLSLADTTSGALNLAKSGANTLTFSANNTYTGNTTISGGALSIATAASLPGFDTNGRYSLATGTSLIVQNGVTSGELASILGTTNFASGATLGFDTTAGDRTHSSAIANSSQGTLNLLKTGDNTLTLTGANSYTGATTVSRGTLVAAGGSAAAGNIVVGNTVYNSVLNVPGGGTMTGGTITVGSAAGSSGAVNVTGGDLTLATPETTDGISFGAGENGYGAFTMSSGTFTQSRLMFGGVNGSVTGGIGVGHVSGGTITTNGWFILSRAGASTGVLTVSGGVINHTDANNVIAIGLAGSGRAELNVAGGLIDNSNRNVTFSGGTGGTFHWTGTGVLNLNAGTLVTNAIVYDTLSPDAGSYLNFSGGTLKASGASTSLLPAFTPSGTGTNRVFIHGAFGSFTGGAVIDTNGFNNTISADLLAPSGNGVATLTVDNGGSGYIGAPAVQILDNGLPSSATAYAIVGTNPNDAPTFGKVTGVVITNPGLIVGTPTVNLLGGGGSGAAISATTGANASGGLTKTGLGTLTLSGTNTFTGATQVTGGNLTATTNGALSASSSLSVASGAQFSFLPAAPATLSLGAGATLSLANGSRIETSFGSTIAIPGAASVSGVVNLVLSGTASAGTHTLITAASGLSGASYNVINPTDFTFSPTISDTAVAVTTATATPLGTAYWIGGLAGSPGDWAVSNGSTTSNWTTDGAGTPTPLVPGSGANVVFSDSGALAANQTGMTLGADMAVNGLTFNSSSPSSLLKVGTPSLTVGAGGITLGASSAAVTLNPNIFLSGSQGWINDSANLLTLGGTVSNGTNLLTTGGTGSTTLANFYGGTGGLTVTGGTTMLPSSTLAAAQTWTNNGGVLEIGNVATGVSRLTVGGTSNSAITGIITGAGGLTKSGTGTLLMNGGQTYKGTTLVGSGSGTAGGGGTLAITGSNPGLTGSVLVGNGGTLQLQSVTALGTTGSTNSSLQLFNGSTLQLRSDSAATFAGTNGIGALNGATVTIDVAPLTSGTNSVLTVSPGSSNIGNAVTINATGSNGYSLALGTILNVTGGATNLTLNPTTANLSLAGYANQQNNANASTLTLGGSDTSNTVTGAIANQASGTGTGIVNVLKTGTSTWTLAGTNTYSGNTIVTGGILNFTGTHQFIGSGEFVVGNGTTGTMNIAGGTLTINSTGVAPTPADSGGRFGMRVGNNAGSDGILNVTAGTLTVEGGGEFLVGFNITASTASSAVGTVNVSGGTLNIGGGNGRIFIGGRTATGTTAGTGTMNVSGTGEVNVAPTTAAVPDNAFYLGGYAGTGTLNLDGGTFTIARQFGKGGSASSTINFNGGLMKMGGTVATLISTGYVANVRNAGAKIDTNGINTAIGSPLIHSGIGGDNATDGGLTKSGPGTLSLTAANTYNGLTTISQGTLQLGSASAAGSLSLDSDIVTQGTFSVSRTNAVSQGTDFSADPITGSGGFAQAGSGTTTLNAANSFTGPTTMTAGTLSVATISDIGTASPLGAGDATNAATNTASLVFNGGTLYHTGTAGSTNRGFTMNAAGTIRYGVGDTNTMAFSGNIVGGGQLNVSGESSTIGKQNVLTLSGDNSGFTGNVNIAVGAVRILDSDGLGSGTKAITMSAGTSGNPNLRLDGSGGDITLPDTFTYTVSNQTFDGCFVNLAGNNTVAGQINITSGGGGMMATSTGGELTISANITATQTGRAAFLQGSSNGKVTGIISDGSSAGTFFVQKTGTGTWTLEGQNTYSGATAVGDGTLAVSSINSVTGGTVSSNLGAPPDVAKGTIALGGGSVLSLTPTTTGTLKYTGTGETTDRVINLAGTTGGGAIDQSGTGLLKFNSPMTATGEGSKTLTLLGSTAGTGEIAGAIVDNSITNTTSLEKSGTGTWTLSGANSYTGSTSVTGGSLILTSAYLADSSSVSVAAGSTLKLDYTGTDVVSALTLGGTPKPNGIYDATNSGGLITGNGKIQVGLTGNFASWAVDKGIPGEPANGDFDKDGLTNLVEYALGLDPKVSSTLAGTFSGGILSFTKGLDAAANGDVTFEIEQSNSLGTWIVVVPNAPASPTISYVLPTGLPKEFARLKVTQIP